MNLQSLKTLNDHFLLTQTVFKIFFQKQQHSRTFPIFSMWIGMVYERLIVTITMRVPKRSDTTKSVSSGLLTHSFPIHPFSTP